MKKMVLKDWIRQKKKFFNVPYTWVNKKNGDLIELSIDNIDAFGNTNTGYKVYSNHGLFKPKKFMIQSMALAFAKNYMRSH